jgi:hypothetical protein
MKSILYFRIFSLIFLITATTSTAQELTAHPNIPRIDVHSHIGQDEQGIANYLLVRERLKELHNVDLAMWINLGNGKTPFPDQDLVLKAGQGRILSCISDYSSHDGFDIDPGELKSWMQKGYVGYKIWAGPPHRRLKEGEEGYPYIDHPALDPTFAAMEKIGMVAASIHIADPNGPWGKRTKWLPDPVEYWKEILAFRHVLERHPDLTFIVAHCMWAICQDAQIDYLRNVLGTFPNVHVDLAATFQYFDLVTRENLRSFMIEYADRILFGADIGRWSDPAQNENYAKRYFRCFQILETDQTINGSFFGDAPIEGLALPEDVLEKIYFKNAMRLYPAVAEQMKSITR